MSDPIVPPSPTPAPGPTPPAPSPAPTSWAAEYGEDIRTAPALKSFFEAKSEREAFGKLAAEHVNVQSLIGKKGVIPPVQGDPPEAWDRFYESMGRPKTAAEYDLKEFQAPEGVPWDQTVIDEILPMLHKRGASNELVKGLLQDYGQIIKGQWDRFQGQLEEGVKNADVELRREWGAAYPAKIGMAKRGLLFAAGNQQNFEVIDKLALADGSLLGDNPQILRLFAKVGEAVAKEHDLPGDKSPRLSLTPEEATLEIAKLEAKDSPYWNADHLEHSIAVKRMGELVRLRDTR